MLSGVRVGRVTLADHDRWGKQRAREFELPGTCPFVEGERRCWEPSAGAELAPALCVVHLPRIRRRPGACAWPRCSYPPLEEFCPYHAKLAAGLIDPAGHDPTRGRVLATVGVLAPVGGRRSGAEAGYRSGHRATARDLAARKLALREASG